MNPRHPIYVISKSRWQQLKTVRALSKIGVPFRLVVEPAEAEQYLSAVDGLMDPDDVLILPESDYGCSIPARNWVWDHALRSGTEMHWCLDDNISGFFRLNRNLKTPVGDGAVFHAAEEFVDRYSNVGQAGFNYFMFAPRKAKVPPLYLNTRIYSCILLRNDLPFRWRGRYNEDTDLSLRILKAGMCTVLFNAFLAFKQTTMTGKGGNTESLYQNREGFDGRMEMALSLQRQHPDVVKVTRKWGRWQHHVDYTAFRRNKLVLRPGIEVADGTHDFGMRLEQQDESGEWREK